MFVVFRLAIRSFLLGILVGVLFAPQAGVETRKVLGERLAKFMDDVLGLASLPPVPPERARTNGHAERSTTSKARTSTNARTSS